jgi:hypothetical protein
MGLEHCAIQHGAAEGCDAQVARTTDPRVRLNMGRILGQVIFKREVVLVCVWIIGLRAPVRAATCQSQ